MGCRNNFATRSNNSVAWNSSYCDDDGGSCSAVWSSSCDGGDGDPVCFHRRKGGGPWKTAVAGWTQHPLSELRWVGWSHTKWTHPAGEWWRGD